MVDKKNRHREINDRRERFRARLENGRHNHGILRDGNRSGLVLTSDRYRFGLTLKISIFFLLIALSLYVNKHFDLLSQILLFINVFL